MAPTTLRCDLVLKIENILQLTFKSVGPKMTTGRSINELPSDAHSVSRLANTALQDVAHAKLAADLFHVHRSTLVGEARIAGDDKQPLKARQRCDDLLHHAISEILLLWVPAHVLKWQNRNGWLTRKR